MRSVIRSRFPWTVREHTEVDKWFLALMPKKIEKRETQTLDKLKMQFFINIVKQQYLYIFWLIFSIYIADKYSSKCLNYIFEYPFILWKIRNFCLCVFFCGKIAWIMTVEATITSKQWLFSFLRPLLWLRRHSRFFPIHSKSCTKRKK